jgi:ribonuclease J
MLEKHIIPQGIDVLITEGTNVGQRSKSVLSEQEISSQFRQIMRKYKNVFILSSSADADRLWSIYRAHNKSRQPFLCDAYQKKMLDIIRDGYDPDKPLYRFVTEDIFDIRNHWTNSKLVEWMHDKGFTMLIRRSDTFQRYLDQVLPYCTPEETCIVYSMFKGYIDPGHKAFNQDLYDFVNQFPNTVFCHTSGHASKECIEKVCCLINPTTAIIPIHKENSFDLIANHCGMILNPIFNECKRVNIIYSILDDLTVNRSVYNDIENFLWANKQEPISEPDNKTKIINHGFDLKTSFRKM